MECKSTAVGHCAHLIMSRSRHYTISVKDSNDTSWTHIDDAVVAVKAEQQVLRMAQASGLLFCFRSCGD